MKSLQYTYSSYCFQITIKLALALLSIFLCTYNAQAAKIPENITFQNLLENKDINMGEGAAFLQDSEGFMWLGGGSALIRYDGYEFRQIGIVKDEKNPNEKDRVHVAQDILEDSHRTIWVATREGLLYYNPQSEVLLQVKDDPNQPAKITTSNIFRVIELSSGEILASSGSGLIVVDPEKFTYSIIAPDEKKSNWLKTKMVNVAHVHSTGDIWLGTGNGLEKLDWKTKKFTSYKVDSKNPDSIPDNHVVDIVSDNNGKFWLATFNGIVHYDPQTQEAKRYVNDPKDRFSLSGNDVWKLLLDSQGVLWVASDGGGLSAYDKDKDRFINYLSEAGRAGSLTSNKVRTVYEDKNGDIWVGNFPVGINFFDRSTAPFITYTSNPSNTNSLSHTSVLSVSEDKNGNLWLGTDGGGLNFFDREKNEFTHFRSTPNDPNTLNGDSVLTTLVDSTGLIWIGTWGQGLASYNPADKKFTRYPFERKKSTSRVSSSTTLNSPTVWFIKEDSKNNIWIATHSGGISKYNPKTKMFTHYPHIENDPESFIGDLAWHILEDSEGYIWISTTVGIDLMDPEKETFTHFTADPKNPKKLNNANVLCILEDSKKRLWFGTRTGLNLFDKKTQEFTLFNKKNGFIDDNIRDILEDKNGILWLATNNGFTSFDPETKKVKNYNRIGGRLLGAFATHSGKVSRNGEIMLGGVEGLRIFNPSELTENTIPPAIALTDLKIFADSVTIGAEDGLLKKSINHTDTIVLDYKKSMFTFGFSALNFRDSAKNSYAYKLEGFDDNWLNVGSQRSAKYTNLNSGTYTFIVKASNNDDVWNENGKKITIVQLPPPWKTWWAYTLYILTAIALLVWFIHTQRRKRKIVEEQNRLLEIKVAERTAEVRQKSNDIQAMLANIPQGLFTVEENGLIHPEYSQYLEIIFETKTISGRKVMELLFNASSVGSDALDSANAALFAMIGEDELNYDLNSALLINEYDITINNKQKYLSLDWNPIIINGVVNKMMVSVRDVTQLREMELSAREQKRQLDIISQLLNLSAEKFLSFEDSARKYILSNREAIEKSNERDEKVIALLFRNMHTVKGNCRTFGFSHLSNTVHEVESIYSALKASSDITWNQKALLEDLDLVEKGVEEYTNIYRNVLGRGNSNRGKGFWMNDETMYNIQQFIHHGELDALKVYMSRLNAVTIEQNLTDIISSLPSIAIQLDKKAPNVLIEPNKILIKLTAQQLVTNIFAHILRNCVDHGLETTAARVAASKNEIGTIYIRPVINNGNLNIEVCDDGRGLNINRLFEKGIQVGIWKKDDKPTLLDIAQLIFYSGVSTKDIVTDISGRGVGMDAVKQFLIEHDGNVSIKLLEDSISEAGFVRFCLVVTLPPELFFIQQ